MILILPCFGFLCGVGGLLWWCCGCVGFGGVGVGLVVLGWVGLSWVGLG
jgi:hypothetical protein